MIKPTKQDDKTKKTSKSELSYMFYSGIFLTHMIMAAKVIKTVRRQQQALVTTLLIITLIFNDLY